jgi:ligand-binding SRPBCC domain-containing protein
VGLVQTKTRLNIKRKLWAGFRLEAMKITIVSHIPMKADQVWALFDSRLFVALMPKFPPVKLLRFDGSQKGDTVSLELDFLLFKNRWTSLITESQESQTRFWFVDEGVELPFFLSKWKHSHIVEAQNPYNCRIIDQIEYRAKGGLIFDWIWFLPLYLQFYARKKQYRNYFLSNV